jgi:hypothetical protein
MSMVSWLLRGVALVVLAVGGFTLYGLAIGYFSGVIPTNDRDLVYGALMLQGFLAAALVAAVLAYPLAMLFRNWAVLAAVLVVLPALLLRLPELTAPSRHTALLISLYEIGAYLVLVVAGTWLASRRLAKA